MALDEGNAGRLDYLDALRGIAVLGVIITHACGTMGPVTGHWGVGFATGVQLFYLVSAYTLFWIYRNRYASEKNGVRNFYIRRFFRIAPLFYSVLVIWTIGYAYFRPEFALSPVHLVTVALFVNGVFPEYFNSIVGVEWSIAIEMTFYLIAPLLFRYITTGQRALVFLILSLFIAEYATKWLAANSDLYASYPPYIMFWFPAQLPVFAGGILAFFVSQSKISRQSAVLLLMASCAWTYMVYRGGDVRYLPHNDLMVLGFAGVLISLASFPARPFVNRVTVSLGRISFSVYLIHLFVMHRWNELVVVPLGLSPWVGAGVLFFGTIIVALPVCMMTYRFIELPGIAIGRRLIRRLSEMAPKTEALS